MSTQKAITANPIKNNGGATKSGGTLTQMASVDPANSIPQKPGRNTGKILLKGNDVFPTLHLGVDPRIEMYKDQLEDYFSYPSGISYITRQGTPVDTYAEFILNSGEQTNVRVPPYIYTFGARPSEFATIQEASTPSVVSYSILSFSQSASLDFSPASLKAASVFTGAVNPTGNLYHNKNITVNVYADTTLLEGKTYGVDAWDKLNLSFPSNTTRVDISTDSIDSTLTLGKAASFAAWSTQSRNINVVAPKSNPVKFAGSGHIVLSASEKAIRINANSDIVQVTLKEWDSSGNGAPNVYYVIPSGASMEYYPIYKNLGVATVKGETVNVDVLA